MTLVAWRRADESTGHSVARLSATTGGWSAHGSEVLASGPEALACFFAIDLDDRWQTVSVRVDAFDDPGDRSLLLTADPDRRWHRDGQRLPDLDGCIDVDVAATPLTNTFPIRRLADLPVGEASTSPVAWVEVPSLRVLRVDQTYRRLDERRWEYSDPTHGSFVLDVDDEGLVTDYEGFARRVDTSATR